MFSVQAIDASSLEEFYTELADQVRHLIDGERNEIANLSNVSALLNVCLRDINWVGFYRWSEVDQELVLGPFQGKPACIRIQSGRGVCGTAVQQRQPIVVPDVFAFPGHIACDVDSRSEVVVPMIVGDKVVGVLDIDSPTPGRFSEVDSAGLLQVVEVVLAGTDFARF